jgi:hypothetical protein
MRADNTTRLERQAGQADLALARRDARGRQSLTTVQLDVLFPAIELEDLHGTPHLKSIYSRIRCLLIQVRTQRGVRSMAR